MTLELAIYKSLYVYCKGDPLEPRNIRIQRPSIPITISSYLAAGVNIAADGYVYERGTMEYSII